MRTDLYYKGGYKYQLQRRYIIQTDICPQHDIVTPYITLLMSGLLIIEAGYAWDGPSGPTIDTASTMAASLVHDAGYQLIREGHLPDSFKDQFDRLLKELIIEDSYNYQGTAKGLIQAITRFRAEYFYDAVHDFGCRFIHDRRPVIHIKTGRLNHERKEQKETNHSGHCRRCD